MRKILTVLALLALPATAQAQYQTGDRLIAAWLPVNEAESVVVRYETRIDTDAAWVNAGVTLPAAEYQWPIPQTRITVGTHAIHVRACNVTACGPALTLPFSVERIVPTPNVPPGGGIRRVPPADAALSLEDATTIAQAYAILTVRRYLTPGDLSWLAARHPPVPPTFASVLSLMDAAYAELVPR
jgi:hypothetical protein